MNTLVQSLKVISRDHMLKGYYRVVQLIGPFVILLTALAIYLFPMHFVFLGPTNLILALLASIFSAHLLCLFLHEIYKNKLFFTIFRYCWIVFFAGIVLITGGVASHLTYLFIFPLLVAAVDLEESDLVYAAAIIFAFLISLFFLSAASIEAKTSHGFTIFILFVITYFINSLAQEKKAIHKDFDRLVVVEHIKSDFISVASNRLRTPLTGALYAFTELSEDEHTPEETKRIVEGGLKEIQTAVTVVNELIQMLELDGYHLKLFSEVVDIPSLVREIASDLEYLIRDKKAEIALDVPSALSVRANPKMIKQAILNIIDNAILYSPKGRVRISVKEIEQACEIKVEDTGIGIEEKDMPIVFERMYRGNNAKQIEPNRSGIGMYTTKRIVELHNGSITLASKVGLGTTVRIMLPMV